MLLLWVGILTTRFLLIQGVLGRFLKAPWFDLVFLLFVLSIPCIEIAILYRAGKAYLAAAEPGWSGSAYDRFAATEGPRDALGLKVLGILLICCLPCALWASRHGLLGPGVEMPDGDLIGIAGFAAGSGANLFLTAFAAHTVFYGRMKSTRLHQKRKPTGCAVRHFCLTMNAEGFLWQRSPLPPKARSR